MEVKNDRDPPRKIYKADNIENMAVSCLSGVAQALGQTDGPLATAKGQGGSEPESGIVAALAALTAGGNQQR